jgi:diguanylate cyclase (GGDEF)-like protein
MARKGTADDQMFAVRLMEHLVVPTFVLDANGRVMIWNRACQRLTGLAARDVIGTANHWRGFYDVPRPCLADLVLKGEWSGLETLYTEHTSIVAGHNGLSAENWCVMPQVGSRRYLAIDAGPIYDETGQLLAVVETLRDITVQREAQTELRTLASCDGLTGLGNRRRFDECLAQEWRRSRRDAQPLSIIMIDIDHFKDFNDAAGHQMGDECLKRVAGAIGDEVRRPGDLAARYGGEEFAVILPDTGLLGASIVADRIMTNIAAMAIPHPAPHVAGTVTVSIGVACSETVAVGAPSSDLGASADAALYRAKRAGRNQVVIDRSDRRLDLSRVA